MNQSNTLVIGLIGIVFRMFEATAVKCWRSLLFRLLFIFLGWVALVFLTFDAK